MDAHNGGLVAQNGALGSQNPITLMSSRIRIRWDPHESEKLCPDPHSIEKLDPDPHKK